jgi:hypothetical protein
MKLAKWCAALLLAQLLCGCLEVEQHSPWRNGQYDGKVDNRPYHVMFHNDRLAWSAVIQNRNNQQNEYNRANP